jgi:hypothetical protein
MTGAAGGAVAATVGCSTGGVVMAMGVPGGGGAGGSPARGGEGPEIEGRRG